MPHAKGHGVHRPSPLAGIFLAIATTAVASCATDSHETPDASWTDVPWDDPAHSDRVRAGGDVEMPPADHDAASPEDAASAPDVLPPPDPNLAYEGLAVFDASTAANVH